MLVAYLLLIQFCIVIFQEWRNEEMALIDELYSGPERKAALVGLLEQEVHLIDRHKLVADEENKDKRIKIFLNKVCSPSVFLWCRVTYFCNLQLENLKTADISRGYHWFPSQDREFTLQDGRKKGTSKRLCMKNVTALLLMSLVVIDLHLSYCFLVFYIKTCLKEGKVRRKRFSSKIIVTLVTQGCRHLSTEKHVLKFHTDDVSLSISE